MPRLTKALDAWGSESFKAVLRKEIEQLSHHELPLQQGLSHSSQVSDEPFQAVILRVDETPQQILATASLFYSGVVAGCSCADDPTPIDTVTECCTLEIRIDKASAEANFLLRDDDAE